jgi:N-acetylglucosaminyl-diphospho-decaprenol L-rhamnosyltransferase
MISVLTVNFRSSDQVSGLVESLRRFASGEAIELIVANNSAADVVPPSSDPLCPVTVLDSPNIGFAGGINLAYHASRGSILMVANPDVRVTAGAISKAVEFLAANPQVGLVLPRLWYPNGELQLSVRRFYTWPVVVYARLPLREVCPHPAFFRRYLYDDLDRTTVSPVDWGLGAAMFMRREDCGDDGIFDERFFMYFEDVDLCYRMWRSGKAVMYCPHIECIHEHRRSSRNPLSRHGWWHLRSLVRFFRKHGGLPQRPAVYSPQPA